MGNVFRGSFRCCKPSERKQPGRQNRLPARWDGGRQERCGFAEPWQVELAGTLPGRRAPGTPSPHARSPDSAWGPPLNKGLPVIFILIPSSSREAQTKQEPRSRRLTWRAPAASAGLEFDGELRGWARNTSACRSRRENPKERLKAVAGSLLPLPRPPAFAGCRWVARSPRVAHGGKAAGARRGPEMPGLRRRHLGCCWTQTRLRRAGAVRGLDSHRHLSAVTQRAF